MVKFTSSPFLKRLKVQAVVFAIIFTSMTGLAQGPVQSKISCESIHTLSGLASSEKIEFFLGKSLSQWIEDHKRAPKIDSADPRERLAWHLWLVSRYLPKVRAGISAMATGSLSHSNLPINQPPHYDTIPMVERFVGEDKGLDFWSDRFKRNIFLKTQYLDEIERKAYEVTIRNGLLYDASGALFDSSNGVLNGKSDSTGRAIIVMDESGRLYLSNFQKIGIFHHTSFLAGGRVAFAGEIEVKNGQVVLLKNQSGHYLPQLELYGQILDRLLRDQVDISQISFEIVK